MAEVCVTCLYKDESPIYVNQDQLLVLTKLLEPCSMFENVKHLLNMNSKICSGCQRKLMDIVNFRNTVLMSLDLLNNMQEVVFKGENYSNRGNYNQPPMQQNEHPTYITLGNEYMSSSVVPQQQSQHQQQQSQHQQQQDHHQQHQHQQDASKTQQATNMVPNQRDCKYISLELMPCENQPCDAEMPQEGPGNNTAEQENDRPRAIKFKQEKVSKTPYVNILAPPELVGSGPSGGPDHNYTDNIVAKEEAIEGQVTQPLEYERQWFIKVLTSDQILEKMEEKRQKPEFVSAPHKCKHCVIVFRSAEQLDAHTEGCHTKAAGRFSCYVCQRRFPTLPALNRHVALHSSRVYVCARCDMDSFDCREIKTHNCVRGKPKKKPALEESRKTWKCSVCHRTFLSHESLTLHFEKEHKDSNTLHCPKCGKGFKVAGRLTNHMKTQHGVHNLTCMNCQKECTSEKALKRHVKVCLSASGAKMSKSSK